METGPADDFAPVHVGFRGGGRDNLASDADVAGSSSSGIGADVPALAIDMADPLYLIDLCISTGIGGRLCPELGAIPAVNLASVLG